MILAYLGSLGFAPGDDLPLHVSTDQAHWSASVVRLPLSTGHDEQVLASVGPVEGRLQEVPLGSYGRIPNPRRLWSATAFTASFWVWPTQPIGRDQGLVAKWSADSSQGFAIYLRSDSCLVLKVVGRQTIEVAASGPIVSRYWYHVVGTYDGRNGKVALYVRAREPWIIHSYSVQHQATAVCEGPWDYDGDLLIGAMAEVSRDLAPLGTQGHFNGKIADLVILDTFTSTMEEAAALLDGGKRSISTVIGAWDFSSDVHSSRLLDRSPNQCHGVLFNMPARAMTGPQWTGSELDFRRAPDQYNAIHFHDDDLEDARWVTGAHLGLSPNTPSGAYGVRVEAGDEEFWIPFFVSANEPSGPLLFLAPTFSYLAYANEHSYLGVDYSALRARSGSFEDSPHDAFIASHPTLGLSLYDRHSDGSGSCYSSSRRPIYNLVPDYCSWLTGGPRHLAADMQLLGWLDRLGYCYEVATDHDLHARGLELLRRYKVVITGCHPEYWSMPMLQAMEEFLAEGGRLMYLGGNGLYWVTSVDPARPHLIEVRRGHTGTRCWTSEPGEVHHSTTGEPGGLWRHRGWAPQRLLGVGFAAMGWGPGKGYRWTSEAAREGLSWVRGDLDPAQILGEFGLGLGGAAGDEIDRVDFKLGSPPNTQILASSAGSHSDHYQAAIEEVESMAPGQGGTECAAVRADLALYTTSTGGAVFSVGSMNWCLSLSQHSLAENGVAQVTSNVLDAFLKDQLPLSFAPRSKSAGGLRKQKKQSPERNDCREENPPALRRRRRCCPRLSQF